MPMSRKMLIIRMNLSILTNLMILLICSKRAFISRLSRLFHLRNMFVSHIQKNVRTTTVRTDKNADVAITTINTVILSTGSTAAARAYPAPNIGKKSPVARTNFVNVVSGSLEQFDIRLTITATMKLGATIIINSLMLRWSIDTGSIVLMMQSMLMAITVIKLR